MPTLTFTTEIEAPQEAVWKFHDGFDALLKITPPTTRVRVLDPPDHLAVGVRFTLVVSQPPVYVPLRWCTVITAYTPPMGFTDIQAPGKGPFALWEHEHRFEKMNSHRTRLVDTITYRAPLGLLGELADRLFIAHQLNALFAYRHRVTKTALESV